MHHFLKKYSRAIAFTFVFITSLSLIVSAISMLVLYSNEMTAQASEKAEHRTLETESEVESLLNDYTIVSQLAAASANTDNESAFLAYLHSLYANEDIHDLLTVRYIQNGVLYDELGNEYTEKDIALNYVANYGFTAGYIGSFEDTSTVDGSMQAVGFLAPLPDNDIADALILYYTRNHMEKMMPEKESDSATVFSILCTTKGEVLAGDKDLSGQSVFSIIRDFTGDKEPVDELRRLVLDHKSGTVAVRIEGDNYIASTCTDQAVLQDLTVIELYNAKELCASTFQFIDAVIGIFVLFATITVMLILFLLMRRAKMKRELMNMGTTDGKLNCPNRVGFEKEAEGILARNQTSYFSVVSFRVRHFKYLKETYGEAEIDNLLRHLRMVCSRAMKTEECYGHAEDGQFLMLVHARDKISLSERLRVHGLVCTRYHGANRFDVLLKYGIYEVERKESVTVQQMVDFAAEASNSPSTADNKSAYFQMKFYDSELRRNQMISEDMELRMESALKNGEFQVFYQPKFNLQKGKQDGCEALVRWYDPKTGEYNRPGLFMPLFESNGFILKLDRYVFTKVCEYLNYTISNGGTVFPVSVNVSRSTAIQPDFIDFYTRTKRKYSIKDGMLMIEFTESFAYENYEKLQSIVTDLHKNGFKCSIDDFGCGYSSYSVLKSLPMDEIKLDKFFLDEGFSQSRDFTILKSVISLGRDLSMKVTQEGVETPEQVALLHDLGCDVVQGYYYSRPISLSDYLIFVSHTKDHDISPKTKEENK